MAQTAARAHVTPELVATAYDALATGDMEQIRRYWAEDMVWLVPGHNPLSGRYNGLDAFLGFMGTVGHLSVVALPPLQVGDETASTWPGLP